MKKLLFVIAAGILFSSCDNRSGSGNVVTQKRNVTAFTKLDVSTGIEVELRKGVPSVTVETDDNLQELVETSVENGELKIRMRDHVNISNADIRVYVTAQELVAINASAGASVETKEAFVNTSTMTLDASAGASINAIIEAPGIDLDASAGGEIRASGRTRNLKVNGSAGSTIHAFDLLSENTVAVASAGASVDVFASVSLDLDASAGGDIDYKGSATLLKKQESGGGSVSKEN